MKKIALILQLILIFFSFNSFANFTGDILQDCVSGVGVSTGGNSACKQIINTQPIKHSLGVLTAKSFPTFPIDEGQYVLKTSGSMVSQKSSPQGYSGSSTGEAATSTKTEDEGWGLALTYLWGQSKKIAYSFTAAYAKNSGSISSNRIIPEASTTTNQAGDHSDKGYFLTANLIYDPFSNFEKFRMPLMLGISYSNASGKWGPLSFIYDSGTRAGHNGVVEQTYEWGGPGWSGGVSIQYPTGPFRWVLFFAVVNPFSKNKTKYTQSDLTTGESVTYENEDEQTGGEGGGIELVYMPWNLSIAYYPTFINDVDTSSREGESLTSFSISWSMDFGEKKAGDIKYDQIIKDVKSVVGEDEAEKPAEKKESSEEVKEKKEP